MFQLSPAQQAQIDGLAFFSRSEKTAINNGTLHQLLPPNVDVAHHLRERLLAINASDLNQNIPVLTAIQAYLVKNNDKLSCYRIAVGTALGGLVKVANPTSPAALLSVSLGAVLGKQLHASSGLNQECAALQRVLTAFNATHRRLLSAEADRNHRARAASDAILLHGYAGNDPERQLRAYR